MSAERQPASGQTLASRFRASVPQSKRNRADGMRGRGESEAEDYFFAAGLASSASPLSLSRSSRISTLESFINWAR
jgi:hypothetical protein